jgi:hypothetical protein
MSYIYAIIPTDQLSKVDLSQTCITSLETLAYSLDKSKTFIDWLGDTPDFITSIEGLEGFYTDDEMREILSTPEWTTGNYLEQLSLPDTITETEQPTE